MKRKRTSAEMRGRKVAAQILRNSFKRSRLGKPSFKRRANARTGGFIGIENKFIDFEFNDTIVATRAGSEMDPPGAGAQTAPGCISATAIGNGESDRDGRKIMLTAVTVNGFAEFGAVNGAVLTATSYLKIALVLDTQTNGQQLSAEDVYDDTTSTEIDALGLRNLSNTARFKVLGTQTIIMSPTAGAGNGTANDSPQSIFPFRFDKKLNIPVLHTGTTAVIASISDNSLHVIACISPAANNSPKLRYASRVRFVG